MKYANLHMHSVYSDGIYTPEELCALAKGKGYKAVALSDHDAPAADHGVQQYDGQPDPCVREVVDDCAEERHQQGDPAGRGIT